MERPNKTGRFDPLIWIHIVVAHQSEKLRPYTVKILLPPKVSPCRHSLSYAKSKSSVNRNKSNTIQAY